MKYLLLGVALLIALFVPAQTTSAHVLITDITDAKGAILHVMPDDNPKAGEEATLFFDLQGGSSQDGTTVELVVRSADRSVTPVKMTQKDTLATGSYIFPAEGAYDLLFTVKQGSALSIFEYTQYVAGTTVKANTYIWAEIVLVSSGVLLLALGVVAFNRRKAIAKHSTF